MALWDSLKSRGARLGSPSISESDVSDFELSDEGALSDAPAPASKAWSTLQNLTGWRSNRPGSRGSSLDSSSVLFDSDLSDTESSGSESAPPSPKANHMSSQKGDRQQIGPAPSEHLGSSGPAADFLNKVDALGIKNAIRLEVEARQQLRIDNFRETLAQNKEIPHRITETQAVSAAIRRTVEDVKSNSRNGKNEDIHEGYVADRYSKDLNKYGAEKAQALAVEEIQNFYHKGAKGPSLSSEQIASQFRANGSGEQAAEIALAYIDAGHDYIRANEVNAHDAGKPHAEEHDFSQKQNSRPGLSELYKERSRGICR
ncbi:hypothetical protein [Mesorhizobium sp. GbtcB19]|uniref:hypothetical protein n=1 Tax=Mesorhizobium sp. GbtcB19 TaxID=2824764 RepID=UPI001C3051C7|nr:hypothetical protein [Mesorhizobium sp. GbtcB19]